MTEPELVSWTKAVAALSKKKYEAEKKALGKAGKGGKGKRRR